MVSRSSPETPTRPRSSQSPRLNRVLPSFLTSSAQHVPDSSSLNSSSTSYYPFPSMSDSEFDVVDGALAEVPTMYTITRPSSPTPTADFSIISPDEYAHILPEGPQSPFAPQYQTNRYPYAYTYHYGQARRTQWPLYSSPSLGSAFVGMGVAGRQTRQQQPNPNQNQGSIRSFLPRIWDALAPGRSPTPYAYSTSPRPRFPHSSSGNLFTSSRAQSPFTNMRYSPSPSPPPRVSPRPSAPFSLNKGKETLSRSKAKLLSCARSVSVDSASGYSSFYHIDTDPGCVDYASLEPLDGEEGELIDEACFVDSRAVTGVDILGLLPPELAIYILILLAGTQTVQPSSIFTSAPRDSTSLIAEAPYGNLLSILSCTLVSRTWNQLANDNAVWRSLFEGMTQNGWEIDLTRATGFSLPQVQRPSLYRVGSHETWSTRHSTGGVVDTLRADGEKLRHLSVWPNRFLSGRKSPVEAPLLLDWRQLYRNRWELDRRWEGAPHDSVKAQTAEPRVMQLAGHTDSVYCLEFDSHRIVTGSRDRTIKIWCVKTGRLLGTIAGHVGSVLCLKFDLAEPETVECDCADSHTRRGIRSQCRDAWQRGFMVSGSSDCSVCVWDLFVRPPDDMGREQCHRSRDASETDPGGYGGRGVVDEDAEESIRKDSSGEQGGRALVKAEVKTVLKGHTGGVLDLRINKDWIVSCSKDAMIKVWKRSTLEHYQTLSGHEGPVNAVGLQGEKVVSASGDGKMILWDLRNGERIRTFEGHDRGLACIEFKDDYIVSGSNDCKIKIWRASTGECLRTLVGHELLVRALSFNPRNGRLVSASYDKTVRVWEVGSGKMVREFRTTHSSHIFDVKFDISRIVSTSHDQKIVVLDFSHGLETSLFT